eukprot:1245453-Rhodomonas_salina.3
MGDDIGQYRLDRAVGDSGTGSTRTTLFSLGHATESRSSSCSIAWYNTAPASVPDMRRTIQRKRRFATSTHLINLIPPPPPAPPLSAGTNVPLRAVGLGLVQHTLGQYRTSHSTRVGS